MKNNNCQSHIDNKIDCLGCWKRIKKEKVLFYINDKSTNKKTLSNSFFRLGREKVLSPK